MSACKTKAATLTGGACSLSAITVTVPQEHVVVVLVLMQLAADRVVLQHPTKAQGH